MSLCYYCNQPCDAHGHGPHDCIDALKEKIARLQDSEARLITQNDECRMKLEAERQTAIGASTREALLRKRCSELEARVKELESQPRARQIEAWE